MEQPFVGAKTLEDAFPDIAVGDEFNRVFESHTAESDQFAVFVIRVDNFQKRLEQLGENITSQVILRLAKIIDGLSQTSSMKWGRLSQDRFGCACLDMDQADAVQLAEEMQRRFALAGKETVSIGLGVHPFRPFEETNTLSNAEKALDHAAFFGPDTVTAFDAVSLNISADKLYQHGDIDGTIEELTKALMLDPENVNVHNSLGVCYGVQDKLALAAESFETARRLDPKDMMAVYNLGLAHLKQDSKATALELFLEAHGIDGANPDVTYQIGMCYREIDQKDAAIEYFEKAAQRTSRGGAHLFRALGDCYLEKEMLSKATKTYEKAVKASPTDATSLSALGYLYGELGENLEIAIVLGRESITIDPDNGLYRLRLGKLYLQSQDHEKALEQLRLAAELGEDCSELIRQTEMTTS